jgi:transcriptional regulator with XRE-family HTH domain
MAAALGLSLATYKRLERGLREASVDEQISLAECTGVPLWFLQVGFAGGDDDEQRRELLVALLRSLDDRFAGIVTDVVAGVSEVERVHARSERRRSRATAAARLSAAQVDDG